MYIQITTRCNMTCKHCCFACTAKGTDMSMDTFKQAIELASDNESCITIGGGEPTLHPLFKDMLWHAVWELARVSNSNGSPAVFLVTNGSMEDTAIKLAHLAERGVIGCRLSQDQYHDASMVTDRVRAAFKRPERQGYSHSSRDDYDCRDIERPLEHFQIQRMGRAASWGGKARKEGCCGGIFCTPRGNLYACECKQVKIGTVADPYDVISEHFYDGCCSSSEQYKNDVLPALEEHRKYRLHHVTVKGNPLSALGGELLTVPAGVTEIDGVKV